MEKLYVILHQLIGFINLPTSITFKLLSSSSSSTNDANDDKRLFAISSSKIYNNGNNSNGALWMSWSPFYLGGLKS